MAKKNTPSFSLNDRDMDFISAMVKKGRFGNRTEVVRAGLRLLEDYEYDQKAKRLRLLIDEGKADVLSGKVTEYDHAEDMAEKIIKRGKARLKVSE